MNLSLLRRLLLFLVAWLSGWWTAENHGLQRKTWNYQSEDFPSFWIVCIQYHPTNWHHAAHAGPMTLEQRHNKTCPTRPLDGNIGTARNHRMKLLQPLLAMLKSRNDYMIYTYTVFDIQFDDSKLSKRLQQQQHIKALFLQKNTNTWHGIMKRAHAQTHATHSIIVNIKDELSSIREHLPVIIMLLPWNYERMAGLIAASVFNLSTSLSH